MAEIKSTLDLVLEKTRHLSMSADEKQQHQTQEAAKRQRGLLHRLENQELSMDQVQIEWQQLKAQFPHADRKELLKDLLTAITLAAQPDAPLLFLRQLYGLEVDPLKHLLADYHRSQANLTEEASAGIKKQLSRAAGISGTAVVPNLQKNADWQRQQQLLQQQFTHALQRELATLALSWQDG